MPLTFDEFLPKKQNILSFDEFLPKQKTGLSFDEFLPPIKTSLDTALKPLSVPIGELTDFASKIPGQIPQAAQAAVQTLPQAMPVKPIIESAQRITDIATDPIQLGQDIVDIPRKIGTVVEGAYKVGKLADAFAVATAQEINPLINREQKKQYWDNVAKVGEEAPLDEVSAIASGMILIYGSVKAMQSVPELYSAVQKWGSNKIRMFKVKERALVAQSDDQILENFKNLPDSMKAEAAKRNVRLRRILKRFGPTKEPFAQPGKPTPIVTPAPAPIQKPVPRTTEVIPKKPSIEPKIITGEDLIINAIKVHGTTSVPESIGFITPKGLNISSSGKKQGSPTEGRNIDHRQISLDALPENSEITEGGDALIEFMNKTKSIRVVSADVSGLNINVVDYPTELQFLKLGRLAKGKDSIFVDISSLDGRTLKSGTFKKVSEYKKFIDEYFFPVDKRKYPPEIYKAYNTTQGTKTAFTDIDQEKEVTVRGVASQGLSGGREEFDDLLNQFKGIVKAKPAEGIESLTEQAKKFKTPEEFIKSIRQPKAGGKFFGDDKVRQYMQKKGLEATEKPIDIVRIQKPVSIKDVQGETHNLKPGEEYRAIELSNNQYLIQDGDRFITTKGKAEDLEKQGILLGEQKGFGKEFEGLEETVKGGLDRIGLYDEAENEAKEFLARKLGNVPEVVDNLFDKWRDTNYSDTYRQKIDDYLEDYGGKTLNEYAKIGEADTLKSEVKFSQYQLPGGENYREILVKPKIDANKVKRRKELSTIDRERALSKQEQSEYDLLRKETETMFKGVHFGEGELSHLRMNDRTTSKGEDVAFIEELQSDWALTGRKEGFKKEKITELPEGYTIRKRPFKSSFGVSKQIYEVVDSNNVPITAVSEESSVVLREALDELNQKGVPSHPSLKNWQELTLKRALRDAVESDAKYLSWISGEQTADRYNLAKYVDSIFVEKLTQGTKKGDYEIRAIKDGNTHINKVVSEKELPDTIGKELAEKAINESSKYPDGKEYSGLDLKVGGEWAKNLYDKQIPSILEKMTKKYGGKVVSIELQTQKEVQYNIPIEIDTILRKYDDFGFDTKRQAAKAILEHKDYASRWDLENDKSAVETIDKWKSNLLDRKQQALLITPEIKAWVKSQAIQPIAGGKKHGDYTDKELTEIWEKVHKPEKIKPKTEIPLKFKKDIADIKNILTKDIKRVLDKSFEGFATGLVTPKTEVLTIIDKYEAGKPLTEIQTKNLLETIRNKRENDLKIALDVRDLQLKGRGQELSETELEIGDKFKIKGEEFEVTKKTELPFGNKITIEDGLTYELGDFETIMVDKGSFVKKQVKAKEKLIEVQAKIPAKAIRKEEQVEPEELLKGLTPEQIKKQQAGLFDKKIDIKLFGDEAGHIALPIDEIIAVSDKVIDSIDKSIETIAISADPIIAAPEDFQKLYKNEWVGNKDVANHHAKVISNNLSKETKRIAEENKLNSDMLDAAIHINIDTKADPSSIEKYKDKLNFQWKKIVKLSQNLPPEALRLVTKYEEIYKRIGERAKKTGVIRNLIEDGYAARIWEKDQKGISYFTGRAKFAVKTRHAKTRVFKTIIEGLSKGYKLKVKSASGNLSEYTQNVNNVMFDKQFLKAGMKIKNAEGDPLFTTKQLEGYNEIRHPNFKQWKWTGEVEAPDKPVRGRNFFIASDGAILEAKSVYAPENIATIMNNVLGKSVLREIPITRDIMRINEIMKGWVLQGTMFHHQAFTRSYLLGAKIKGYKTLNPYIAMQKGLESIDHLNPMLDVLIKNGMTLGVRQDFESITKGVVGKVQEKWLEMLFEKYGAGLKSLSAINELESQIKEHPGVSVDKLAERVAELVNNDFGGLNLKRMARNPTFQDIMRFFVLAADWTESNFRTIPQALPAHHIPKMLKIAKEEGWTRAGEHGKEVWKDGEVARRFWWRVVFRGFLALETLNLMITRKHIWQNDKGHKLEVDVTPIARKFGYEGKERLYFPLLGHMLDPRKMVTRPDKFILHKSSFFVNKALTEFFNEDWAGRPFLPLREARKRGTFVGNRFDDAREWGYWRTVPTRTAYQIASLMPVGLQAVFEYMRGQISGFETFAQLSGTRLRTAWIQSKSSLKREYRRKRREIVEDYEGTDRTERLDKLKVWLKKRLEEIKEE